MVRGIHFLVQGMPNALRQSALWSACGTNALRHLNSCLNGVQPTFTFFKVSFAWKMRKKILRSMT